MRDAFRALVVDRVGDTHRAEIRTLNATDLPDGEVLVEVAYSSLNYKDGLAITGRAPICRCFPMVAGIDLAGTVLESRAPEFAPGDRVLVNGYGLSERHWGGYGQLARLRAEWLVHVPERLDLRQAMAIGTAGYTAMLCVMALERHGLTPAAGPVLVTGAAGGVGSIAVCLLARLGFEVVASSGRAAAADYLLRLGAREVIDRGELARPAKPLEAERWAGAVDAVGGQTLATVLTQTCYGGAVAACGLAGGADLPVTVYPFILRAVTLEGIDSVMAPMPLRVKAWRRLAEDLDLDHLDRLSRVEPLGRLPELAEEILAGRIQGRVVIDVNA